MKQLYCKALCATLMLISISGIGAQAAPLNGEVDDDGNFLMHIIVPALLGVICALPAMIFKKKPSVSTHTLLAISTALGVIIGVPIVYILNDTVCYSIPSTIASWVVFVIGLYLSLFLALRNRANK